MYETGMSRLALSDADKEARDWFFHTTKSLGCDVTVDTMGNVFAVRPGRRRGFPPTCAGSHLDTQPTGGRYDGILGVCAGLEMLKVLHEQKIETHFPVGVVNWTKYASLPQSQACSPPAWTDRFSDQRGGCSLPNKYDCFRGMGRRDSLGEGS